MSLINGQVDRHPVNVVHMCTVHRGAEESTPAFQQHCGGSFLRVGEQERGGGRKKRSESREKRMKLWGSLSSAVVKGSEWERRPCSQPHGPFSLGIMEAFLWFLTPLSHAGNGQPSTHCSQQTRSDTLTRWIIEFYTQESHPLPWPGPPLHVALTGTLPGSTSHLGKESESGPVFGVRKENIKREMVLWCEGDACC